MVEYRKDSLPKKKTAMNILSAYGGGVALFNEGVEYTHSEGTSRSQGSIRL